MTEEQLAELEALAEKATKGAWFIVPYGDGDTFVVHSDDEQRIFFPPLLVGYSATAGSLGDPAQIESDMKFIAASRTAIPSLIAEVKRLRGEVADRAAVVEECARLCEQVANEYGATAVHFEDNKLWDEARYADGQCGGAVRCYTDIRALATQQEKDHG